MLWRPRRSLALRRGDPGYEYSVRHATRFPPSFVFHTSTEGERAKDGGGVCGGRGAGTDASCEGRRGALPRWEVCFVGLCDLTAMRRGGGEGNNERGLWAGAERCRGVGTDASRAPSRASWSVCHCPTFSPRLFGQGPEFSLGCFFCFFSAFSGVAVFGACTCFGLTGSRKQG